MGAALAIQVENVEKSFNEGRYTVYKGISLGVKEGSITFLLGPSGVGKSVLLRHILGLLKPDRGEILIFGQSIPYGDGRAINDMRRNFGMLFQNAALFDDLSVFENVAFPLREHRREMNESTVLKKVCEKLDAVGLDPKNTLDKFPRELSGGMKKRVGLARAIVLEPRILLYDEPTTGLDPVTRSMVDDLIVNTNKNFGLTSLVISHDILSAMFSANDIAFLYSGEIVFHGSPELFRKSKHPMIRSFIEAEEKHFREFTT